MHKYYAGVQSAVLLFREAISGRQKKFTTGSVNRSIFLLAVPMVLELLMESLMVCVSLFYVSQLGAGGIAIVGATESIVSFTFSFGTGLTIAATALISRRVGAGNAEDAGVIAMQVIWVALAFGVTLSVAAGFFTRDILMIMGLDVGLIESGITYARLMFWGTWLLLLRMSVNGILRGAGNAAFTMRTLWISNIANIVLCPVFMFGWGVIPAYGITGVGIAALASRLMGIAYQAYLIRSGKTIIMLSSSSVRVDWPYIRKILRLTFGGIVQYVVPSSSWIIMIRIISMLGTAPLAAYIIAQRISSIFTMPAWGIGNAAGTLTGQNLGAGNPERAAATVWKAGKINMVFLCVVGLGWMFLAAPVSLFFTKDEAVRSLSVSYLHFISVAYILLGYTMVISRALNAAGEVRTVTILYAVMFYALQIPLAYLMGIQFSLGTTGVFAAILISELFLSCFCIYIFRKGKWKTIKL